MSLLTYKQLTAKNVFFFSSILRNVTGMSARENSSQHVCFLNSSGPTLDTTGNNCHPPQFCRSFAGRGKNPPSLEWMFILQGRKNCLFEEKGPNISKRHGNVLSTFFGGMAGWLHGLAKIITASFASAVRLKLYDAYGMWSHVGGTT